VSICVVGLIRVSVGTYFANSVRYILCRREAPLDGAVEQQRVVVPAQCPTYNNIYSHRHTHTYTSGNKVMCQNGSKRTLGVSKSVQLHACHRIGLMAKLQ